MPVEFQKTTPVGEVSLQQDPVVMTQRETKWSKICKSESKCKILMFIGYFFSVVLPLFDLCILIGRKVSASPASKTEKLPGGTAASTEADPTTVTATSTVAAAAGVTPPAYVLPRAEIKAKFMQAYEGISRLCTGIHKTLPMIASIQSTKFNPRRPANFKVAVFANGPADLYGKHKDVKPDAFVSKKSEEPDAWPPLFQSNTSDAVLMLPTSDLEASNITRFVEIHGKDGYEELVEEIMNNMEKLVNAKHFNNKPFCVSTHGVGITEENGSKREAADLLNIRFEEEPVNYDPSPSNPIFKNS